MTIKEMILTGKYSVGGEDDLTIIRDWFIQNHKESEGLALIPALAAAQATRLENRIGYVKSWAPSLPTPKAAKGEKKFTAREEDYLRRVQLIAVTGNDLKSYSLLYNWAKDWIPTRQVPSVFFVPALSYLSKYGIEFIMNDTERKQMKMNSYEETERALNSIRATGTYNKW